MIRLGAATVVHGVRRGMPIAVASSLADGLEEAGRRGALRLVGASTVEAHLRTLADRAAPPTR